MKFVRVGAGWIIIAFVFPIIKNFYDSFTAPITGALVTAGTDDWTLALMTGIPWIIPLATFVWTIWYLTKPEEENTISIGGVRLPRR